MATKPVTQEQVQEQPQLVWLAPDTQERDAQRLYKRLLLLLFLFLMARIHERDLLEQPEDEQWSENMTIATAITSDWWTQQVNDFAAEIKKIFVAVSLFNDLQFRKQIKRIFGVVLPQSQALGLQHGVPVTPTATATEILGASADVNRVETYIEQIQRNFIAQAEVGMQSLGDTFIATTERDIRHAIQAGQSVGSILESIANRASKLQEQGILQAQAGILNLNATLSENRQRSVGIEDYIWRTRLDSRVRDTHRALEGTAHRWILPPNEGHPGQPYMCRCWAEPLRPTL